MTQRWDRTGLARTLLRHLITLVFLLLLGRAVAALLGWLLAHLWGDGSGASAPRARLVPGHHGLVPKALTADGHGRPAPLSSEPPWRGADLDTASEHRLAE